MKTIMNIICAAFALFAFACFALLPAPKAFGIVPPPDGSYPGFNTQKGLTLFKTSLLALATQQLVGIRFLRTLPGV
jgi:hypothetical protein